MFNEAIRRGGEKATAIPILEHMNLPQLSRKPVENCLQKYKVQKRLAQHASSTIVNQSKITSQTPPFVVPGNHSNVLNSNEFLMNFNKPPQEPYLPQARVVPSLVLSNEFFTELDDLIQNFELDLNSNMIENQIDTYHSICFVCILILTLWRYYLELSCYSRDVSKSLIYTNAFLEHFKRFLFAEMECKEERCLIIFH